MSFSEVNSEPRQDWQQTSTGVGHHYRRGYYFPSTNFKVTILKGIVMLKFLLAYGME